MRLPCCFVALGNGINKKGGLLSAPASLELKYLLALSLAEIILSADFNPFLYSGFLHR
jgi:hypothetical protein